MTEETNQCAYIVDVFNPYNKKQNEKAVFKCKIHDKWIAVYKISCEWGQPVLDGWPADTSEFNFYYIYNTAKEAIDFLHELKQLEGIKF